MRRGRRSPASSFSVKSRAGTACTPTASAVSTHPQPAYAYESKRPAIGCPTMGDWLSHYGRLAVPAIARPRDWLSHARPLYTCSMGAAPAGAVILSDVPRALGQRASLVNGSCS